MSYEGDLEERQDEIEESILEELTIISDKILKTTDEDEKNWLRGERSACIKCLGFIMFHSSKGLVKMKRQNNG